MKFDFDEWKRNRVNLHERIAKVLGWTLEESQSFSLAALRDLVRPVSPKLANEITLVMEDMCR